MNLYIFQSELFKYTRYLMYFLYIVVALGISSSAPAYLDTLVYYTKLYVSLFLIVRFNPFRLTKFTPLDAKIAFNAGMFLLFATAVNGIIGFYLNNMRVNINTYIAAAKFHM
jgi:hypothetical protein